MYSFGSDLWVLSILIKKSPETRHVIIGSPAKSSFVSLSKCLWNPNFYHHRMLSMCLDSYTCIHTVPVILCLTSFIQQVLEMHSVELFNTSVLTVACYSIVILLQLANPSPSSSDGLVPVSVTTEKAAQGNFVHVCLWTCEESQGNVLGRCLTL